MLEDNIKIDVGEMCGCELESSGSVSCLKSDFGIVTETSGYVTCVLGMGKQN
jgi:hypothetical protein